MGTGRRLPRRRALGDGCGNRVVGVTLRESTWQRCQSAAGVRV